MGENSLQARWDFWLANFSKLQPPGLIAREGEESRRLQEEAARTVYIPVEPPSPSPAERSHSFPLGPWRTVAGNPSPRRSFEIVSVLDVFADLFGGKKDWKTEDDSVVPLNQRWDEDFRAAYSCDYYRNCANTVPLFEIRVPLP